VVFLPDRLLGGQERTVGKETERGREESGTYDLPFRGGNRTLRNQRRRVLIWWGPNLTGKVSEEENKRT